MSRLSSKNSHIRRARHKQGREKKLDQIDYTEYDCKMPSRDALRNLDPEIYRRAAELVQEKQEWFTCYAVETACREFGVFGGNRYRYDNAWAATFGQDGPNCNKHPFWNHGQKYSASGGYNAKANSKLRNLRITSLLMMADIVQAARR